MSQGRNTAVFELMGKVSDLAGEEAPHAALPAIVAWEHRLEDAVLFLAQNLLKASKRGKKPVLMHSLRVGSALISRGLAADVVIAGMLHDIMEKSAVTLREISRRFGSAVALMVGATTNHMDIEHPLARYEDSLKRCAALGEGALMIRVADLLDNCDRLTALGQYERLDRLGEKLKMLTAYAKAFGLDPKVISDLSLRSRRIKKLTGSLALLPALSPEAAALKAVSRQPASAKKRDKKQKTKKKRSKKPTQRKQAKKRRGHTDQKRS